MSADTWSAAAGFGSAIAATISLYAAFRSAGAATDSTMAPLLIKQTEIANSSFEEARHSDGNERLEAISRMVSAIIKAIEISETMSGGRRHLHELLIESLLSTNVITEIVNQGVYSNLPSNSTLSTQYDTAKRLIERCQKIRALQRQGWFRRWLYRDSIYLS